ncbi:MAG TPA: ADOP family duplicated permease [Gemmatimonadales bacterium]|jgi:predicted permease
MGALARVIEALLADLRQAIRQLWRSPAFSVAAILTLALGIGACTAAYSLARNMLWRPLPFGDADRIVVLKGENLSRGISGRELSYLDIHDLAARARTVTGIAAVAERPAVAESPEGADRITSWVVEPKFFSLFNVPPALGRVFRNDEANEGAGRVVMLSYPFWTRRFGRDTSVIGKTVTIDGSPRLIVGVMPRAYQVMRADIWLPALDPHDLRDQRNFIAAAGLAPGATLRSAQVELNTIAAGLAQTYPASNRGWGVEVRTYRDDNVDAGTRRGLALLLGAVAMVLLIACANVAGIMLARGASRARELAVRAAIGGSRGRLLRQALVECAVLAVLGAAIGTGLALWGNDLLISTRPAEDIPVWLNPTIDLNTLLVTAAVAIGSVLLFGLPPALRASRPEVVGALKGSASAPSGTRARSILVVVQVGLAVVLLSVTALFSQSFLAARSGNLGFDDSKMLAARVFFGAVPDQQRAAWVRDALARIRAVPGVTEASLTGAIPGDDGGDHRGLAVADQPVAAGQERMVTLVPSYADFDRTLGLTPKEGRWFTAAEAQDGAAAVAVVGAGLALTFWPGKSPLGRRIRALPDTTWLTVIGVLGDIQWEEFGEDHPTDHLQLHVPYARAPWRSVALMVRTSGNPRALVDPVRRAALAVHADVPVFDAMTMSQDRQDTSAGQQSWAWLFGVLGCQALIMTAIGLYGLLAFGVAQRRREIGVRVALGARPALVVRMIVRHSVLLTLSGLAVGLVGATMIARLIAGMVWGVSGSFLPVVLATSTLLATALLAAAVPARRAAHVDPIIALRAE